MDDDIVGLGIIFAGILRVSLNLEALIKPSKLLGEGSSNPSSWMYSHLQMLQNVVPRNVRHHLHGRLSTDLLLPTSIYSQGPAPIHGLILSSFE